MLRRGGGVAVWAVWTTNGTASVGRMRDVGTAFPRDRFEDIQICCKLTLWKKVLHAIERDLYRQC